MRLCKKIFIINLITNQFCFPQHSSLGKPHTKEKVLPTFGNSTESLQLTLPSVEFYEKSTEGSISFCSLGESRK